MMTTAENLWFMSANLLVCLKQTDNAEGMSIIEQSHGQGFWAAAACSSSRSETFYILEGRFRFQCDGKIIEAGVGDTVHCPRGSCTASA